MPATIKIYRTRTASKRVKIIIIIIVIVVVVVIIIFITTRRSLSRDKYNNVVSLLSTRPLKKTVCHTSRRHSRRVPRQTRWPARLSFSRTAVVDPDVSLAVDGFVRTRYWFHSYYWTITRGSEVKTIGMYLPVRLLIRVAHDCWISNIFQPYEFKYKT